MLTIDHDGRRREVALDAPVFTIGRDAACSLVVEHASVSRTHCQLVRRGNAYDVEDLGSQAGTRLDGQRVTRAPIKPGQTLVVGPARIVYSAEGAATDATIPAGEDAPVAPGWALYGTHGPRAGVAVCFAARMSIGRAAGCDLVLDGGEVSTQHCELVPEAGHVALVDLGSTNGTRVGEAVVRDATLRGGEVLAIGPHVFVLDRYPLPPAPPPRSAVAARAAELALTAAIALLLWGLAARLVVRPLWVTRPAVVDPRAVPFAALGSDRLPRHYAFQYTGDWELNVLLAEGLLRVVGTGSSVQELSAVLAGGLPVGDGWRVRGLVEAVQGPLEVALVGVYRDTTGAVVATHHSSVLALVPGQRQVVEMPLPAVEGAAWVQPGYYLRGRVREARLGPLAPEPLPASPLASGRVRVAGIDAVLSAGGAVDIVGLARAELAVMNEGVVVTSPRTLAAASPRPVAGGFALASEQVGLGGTRAPFTLELAARGGGVGARLAGGHATHVCWTWTIDPTAVELYYQGSPREPGETRPLADELAVARADGTEHTVRFSPPVYLEGRWRDPAGRERWQLRFAERAESLDVECQPGNRQRERDLVRVRLQFGREVASANLPEALRSLARWRALETATGGADLAAAQRQVDEATFALVSGAIADRGPDGWARLVTLLATYRGTVHEDALEAEVARRVVDDADEPARVQRARWLLSEGRYMAAYGYFALARVTLSWLVHLEPGSQEAADARELMRLLPVR